MFQVLSRYKSLTHIVYILSGGIKYLHKHILIDVKQLNHRLS